MGLTTNPCLATVLVRSQSCSNNMAKVICLLVWAGLASAAPQRTILLGGRDNSLDTGSVVDTILAQLDTPINNAIQAALSGLYTSKTVSSSPVETSFTSVVSQTPAITVQTSGTFSSAEGSEDNIEGQFNGFSTSEGDSSSFTSNTVSEDSASFFSSSLQSSQDSNSFFSSNSFQGSSSSGSLEDSYVPLTTFTDSTSSSDSGSGFNSGSSSSSSSSDSSSSIVSQVVGSLGPQIDEAVRAALAALETTTTTTTTTTAAPEPAPAPVTSVVEQSQSQSESQSQASLVKQIISALTPSIAKEVQLHFSSSSSSSSTSSTSSTSTSSVSSEAKATLTQQVLDAIAPSVSSAVSSQINSLKASAISSAVSESQTASYVTQIIA